MRPSIPHRHLWSESLSPPTSATQLVSSIPPAAQPGGTRRSAAHHYGRNIAPLNDAAPWTTAPMARPAAPSPGCAGLHLRPSDSRLLTDNPDPATVRLLGGSTTRSTRRPCRRRWWPTWRAKRACRYSNGLGGSCHPTRKRLNCWPCRSFRQGARPPERALLSATRQRLRQRLPASAAAATGIELRGRLRECAVGAGAALPPPARWRQPAAPVMRARRRRVKTATSLSTRPTPTSPWRFAARGESAPAERRPLATARPRFRSQAMLVASRSARSSPVAVRDAADQRLAKTPVLAEPPRSPVRILSTLSVASMALRRRSPRSLRCTWSSIMAAASINATGLACLARDVGRRAVHRLEDRRVAADVGARRHAQPADQAGNQVGEDVAEQVGRSPARRTARVEHQLHRAAGVDDHRLHRDAAPCTFSSYICSAVSRKMPVSAFMMLALCTMVTFLRPVAMACSKAYSRMWRQPRGC